MSTAQAAVYKGSQPRVLLNLGWLAFGVAVAAAGFVTATGPGFRLGLWGYNACYKMMIFAAYTGLVAAAFAAGLVPFVLLRERYKAVISIVLAIVVGLTAAAVPWKMSQTMHAAQGITDVSTDTVTPPPFIAVLKLHSTASRDSAAYPGEAVANVQRQAFPDIQPVRVSLPPIEAFALAHGVAVGLGWRVVSANGVDGVIEAYDPSPWYGLTDDIVIRVRPEGSGARIDIRSRARNDGQDFGKNGARVRAFLRALRG
ncbi:MAG: DUF1499 domain-containing protein [Gemmatimonas sp.]